MSARELIQRATGLDLSEQTAERALRERMAIRAIANSQDYLQRMTPAELAELVELVVVPESWMFRDADAFAAATAFVQRRLAERPDSVVRILSIPCAGGEEPYSMAMALADAGVGPASFRIEGVDLSTVALERAAAGRYTRNAFRGGDLAFRKRHFSPAGADYQISDALRAQVSFAQGNLLAIDAGAARYDVIFCRNLLIYFDEPTTAAAIARLHALLADDGMLLAGYAEVPSFCRNGFAPMHLPGAFALQKAQAAVPAHGKAGPKPRIAAAVRKLSPAPAPVRERRLVKTAPPPPLASAEDVLAQARRLADQGDYRASADACQAMLAAHPDSADAYFILGMVSECENKPGAADDYWRRCVYLRPDHYEALCHLALLADQAGDARQAATFRQRAARVYGRREADVRLAQ